MRKTVEILGVSIDSITMDTALKKILGFQKEERLHTVFTPNAEILMAAQNDTGLKDILNSADLTVADGMGVVVAARILGLELPQKISGIDLTMHLLPAACTMNIPVYLLGGMPGVSEDAARNLKKEFPGLDVRGCFHGYFDAQEETEVINRINNSGAAILLVGLGAPRQEKWIYKNSSLLDVRVCIGIGGSLDVFSGRKKLAPEIIRKSGLEWFYRLCLEPWRYKRMSVLPVFAAKVIYERLKKIFS